MAIAYDASAIIYQGIATSSQNLAHTCTGTNLVLVVFTASFTGDNVTGVTYNGVAMTQTGSMLDINSDKFMKAWVLVNPSTGTNNITVTLDTDRRLIITSMSLTGCKQTAQPDASLGTTGTSTTPNGTITTVADNSWSVGSDILSTADGNSTSSTNCTVVQNIDSRGGIGYGGPKTPAGSFSQTIALSGGSGSWGFFQVSVAPYVAPVGPANLKTYNTNPVANIKTIDTNPIANVKTLDTNA